MKLKGFKIQENFEDLSAYWWHKLHCLSLFGGHNWRCSGLISDSELRWQSSADPMGYLETNPRSASYKASKHLLTVLPKFQHLNTIFLKSVKRRPLLRDEMHSLTKISWILQQKQKQTSSELPFFVLFYVYQIYKHIFLISERYYFMLKCKRTWKKKVFIQPAHS